LEGLAPRYLLNQLLILVHSDGDMLDRLLDAVVGKIGFSQVVMCQNQSKVRFSVVKDKQLVENELLDLYVYQLFPIFVKGSLCEVI
jgi:2C-methyl-D-erythritol 2,4-cyclodiphosphate synthase